MNRITLVATFSVALIGLAGCGGDDESSSVAEELTKQRELAEARKQGAKDAAQSARIKQLQRELKENSDSKSDSVTIIESSQAPATDYVETPSSSDWPGGSGYTVVLASLGSESEASAFQSEASSAGLDAGILNSSDFSSLNPGYWVVFSGTFDSSDGAADRASYAKSLGYGSAYPRLVSP
ncbi:MAG: SPOR domain-containing protein [Thermoleophilia bacterium]|nr:SPOR domain-containing protein [Thermoleophilia bacterium]